MQIVRIIKLLIFNSELLNCCGIKAKLNYPQFIEIINDFDILCLVETKIDDCDIINIPDYTVKMKRRKFISFKNSRGMILAYTNEYEKQISELPKQSNFTLWFKISKELTGCDEDINEF